MPNENLHDNAENLSDFDKAWAEIESTPSSQTENEGHTEESEKTPTEETATDAGASEETQETTKEENTSTSAEAESVDQFAGWTEDQKSLYLKTERDGKAHKGRLRAEQQRNKTLEQELAEMRLENERLQKESRKPTEFELAHPEYAEDIKTLVGTNSTQASPDIDPVDLVLAAHPDATEIVNDDAFQAWLSEQDDSVIEAANGQSARAAIAVITDFKASQTSQQNTSETTDRTEGLAAMAGVGGSQSQPDLRDSSQLTAQEQFDLAWADFE